MVRCSRVRAFVRSCVTLAPFSSLWSAFTLAVHIKSLNNESVHREEQHTRGIYTILYKIATLFPLESFEVGQLFCLFMKLGSLLSARCRHCDRTRAFVYFIFQLTKNADRYGIVL